MSPAPLLQSRVEGFPLRKGKVRDIYDLGDTLAFVATDRISAFDWVMPNGIPGKGVILTAMSKFWLDWLRVPNHWLSDDIADFPTAFRDQAATFRGRTQLVTKTKVIPIECVARGYLAGSGWKEYLEHGTVCGIPLPHGLHESERLPEPIFTPATKAETGHDENIAFAQMAAIIGENVSNELKERTLEIYRRAATYAESRGIILADTKLEWGTLPNGEIILIDEVLTPDSSRFWPKESYRTGISPPSFDKQFLRDWLETTTWDKASPPPNLPQDVIDKTAAKYREAYERLTVHKN